MADRSVSKHKSEETKENEARWTKGRQTWPAD